MDKVVFYHIGLILVVALSLSFIGVFCITLLYTPESNDDISQRLTQLLFVAYCIIPNLIALGVVGGITFGLYFLINPNNPERLIAMEDIRAGVFMGMVIVVSFICILSSIRDCGALVVCERSALGRFLEFLQNLK